MRCEEYLDPDGMPSQCLLNRIRLYSSLLMVPFCIWSIVTSAQQQRKTSSKFRTMGFLAGCGALFFQRPTQAIVFCVILVDEWLQLQKSTIASGQQLFFYLIQSILGALGLERGSRYSYGCILCFIAFVCELYGSDTSPPGYDNSTIFGKFTISYVNNMLKVGFRGQITRDDFARVPETLNTSNAYNSFKLELEKSNNKSLVAVIRYNFWRIFAVMILEIITTLVTYIRPLLLALFLTALSRYQEGTQTVYPSIYLGLLLGCAQLSVPAFASLSSVLNNIISTTTRAALMETIYRKASRLSNEARLEYDSAKIMNLLNVDTAIIQTCYQYFPTLLDAPIGLMACTWQLYHFIGNASFAAIPVYAIFIPYSSWHTKRMFRRFPELMKAKDVRTKSLWGLFKNVKSLKLYAWEEPYEKEVAEHRDAEIGVQRKYLKLICIMRSVSLMLDDVVASAVFIAYLYYSGKALTPEIVFPTLSLLSFLSDPLTSLPSAVSGIGRTLTSQSRINEFLAQRELKSLNYYLLDEFNEVSVALNDATISWNENITSDKAVLRNLNLRLGDGDLCCVVGRVGSGKTALLRALCNQMHIHSGSISISGSVAYCPQEPWLQFKTVRENILFGLEFDEEFYQKTIESCELSEDVKSLPNGDLTQVGEKGICLSGGQKARVALARAVYSRSRILIFDDVLSAVDEHVCRNLVAKLFSPDGLLSGKTIILATNSKPVLKHASVVLKLGEHGAYSLDSSASTVVTPSPVESPCLDADSDRATPFHSIVSKGYDFTRDSLAPSERMSVLAQPQNVPSPVIATESTFETVHRHIEEEEQDVRANVFKVFGQYLASVGWRTVTITAVLFVAAVVFPNLILVWLAVWSDKNIYGLAAAKLYVIVYLFLSLGAGVTVFFSVYWFYGRVGNNASYQLHARMVERVLESPLSFFDKTPMGVIMNRFTGDVSTLDQTVPNVLYNFCRTALMAVASLTITLFGSPVLIVVLVPLLLLYNNFRKTYIPCSRQLQRIMSASRGPILSHIEESVKGAGVISAFTMWPQFIESYRVRSDYWMEAVFLSSAVARWLNWRIRLITVTITWSTALSLIALVKVHPMFSIGLAGIVMHSTQRAGMLLSRIIRTAAGIETSAVAVERIFEFCELESEAPRQTRNDPKGKWPLVGQVAFKNYSTRYRPELPLVLKDITVSFKPQEKIGVVGRTGAAKSTLCLAIFRILEAAQGSTRIDDVDISTIGLKALRHNLSIIPQDAQIFAGTLRHNLSPLGDFDDEKLRRVLRLCHLERHFYEELGTGLDSELLEGGENLSRGQSQLICLGRALLHDSPVLVLDEATASVDTETDAIVQETIRKEFKHKTIITIAHRLNTIMDCDRILVLESGEVKEFDTPQALLDAKGAFYRLAQHPEEIG